jgi:hypothetical protein
MLDESNQYAMLTKIFVESFKFTNSAFKPSIAFKIYDKSITMSLERFCCILGITMFETAKKIQNRPADLLEIYRRVTNDDDRTAQRGKIRNIQLPAIRYFAYLATSILGRENTSNISNYHLAFLATALDVSKRYNLGALIARRLAAKGPIYGGNIAACIVAALGLSIAPNDTLLVPQRLDLAAMKIHHFVTTNSCAGKLVYRMLFTDGDEREVPLLQPSLFSICRRPWSRSKESWMSSLGCLASTYNRASRTMRKRRRQLTITPCTTPGRPRAHIRMKVLLHHILEMPLHGRIGIDLYLGQKPKLGGRYADDSLIYTSYFVGTLYIHVSLSFSLLFLFLFLLSKTQKDQKHFRCFSLFASLVS